MPYVSRCFVCNTAWRDCLPFIGRGCRCGLKSVGDDDHTMNMNHGAVFTVSSSIVAFLLLPLLLILFLFSGSIEKERRVRLSSQTERYLADWLTRLATLFSLAAAEQLTDGQDHPVTNKACSANVADKSNCTASSEEETEKKRKV